MNDPFKAIIQALEPNPSNAGVLLEGVSFAAKDLFDVAGQPTRAGNPQFAQRWGIPTQDAWAVAALKRAGASLVGKTHTHELAYGMSGINPHFGTPKNPKVEGGIPGGSSSGSGVAVAAGLVPLALGSDTGGSVRIPASMCGTYAYRPTHGAISAQGVVPLAPSYDTVGLLAANPEIMETAAGVLLSSALPVVQFERALIMSDALELSSPQAQLGVQRIVQKLERFGLKVSQQRLGLLQEARETQRVLQGAQAWGYHQRWVEEQQPLLGEDVRRLLEMAAKFSSAEIGRSLSDQVLLRAQMGSWLEPDTIVILPSTPSSAPQISDFRDAENALEFRWRALSLTCYASILGAPVVAIPTEEAGEAPIGVQLVGSWGSDMGLLRLARRLEGCV